jgi:glycosyltransferase involved in cell wall biosynthesis
MDLRPPDDAVTAVLVVRNEERTLGRALESLRGAVDELVVVHDGPCDDRTLDIAAAHGARIFVRPFAGFCEAHFEFARAEARGAWLLQLDADERLSPELAGALRTLARDPAVDGYTFELHTFYEGRELRLGLDRTFRPLRLARRDRIAFDVRVHGRRTVPGRTRHVPLVLEHRPPGMFLDEAYFEAKAERWADANARAIAAASRPRSRAFWRTKAIVWAVGHFVKLYFFRLYLVSGATGLRFCWLIALFQWRTYRRLEELAGR